MKGRAIGKNSSNDRRISNFIIIVMDSQLRQFRSSLLDLLPQNNVVGRRKNPHRADRHFNVPGWRIFLSVIIDFPLAGADIVLSSPTESCNTLQSIIFKSHSRVCLFRNYRNGHFNMPVTLSNTRCSPTTVSYIGYNKSKNNLYWNLEKILIANFVEPDCWKNIFLHISRVL